MKEKDEKKGKKKRNGLITLAIGAGVVLGTLAFLPYPSSNIERISFTEYEELLNEGKIDTVTYNEEKEYMTIALFDDVSKNLSEAEREKYSHKSSDLRKVIYPDNEDFKVDLLRHGVIVMEDGKGFGYYFDTYGTIAIYILFFGGMLFIMSKGSPMASTGFTQKALAEEINVTFDDVIGHDEVKADLQLLVKQLKSGVQAKDLSHGVLFEGGAGTGKTMLAKAVAHEAGVNFLSVSSSNLVEMYVGLGAKRVRDIFKQARELAPCVLFFDEIDAVGAKRGSQRSHRENDQTINALLTELDGFNEKGDILVIAATNRADDLDDALLRSGRFDRKIKIEAPRKWETRQELFEHYVGDKVSDDVNTEILAKQTVGFSGADIAAICREARLIAFREDTDCVTQAFLEEAIDKMVFKGNRSNDEQHKEDLECVAYHEAGHAVMTYLTDNHISRISIMGMTSGVGGAVFQSDNERFFETKEQVEAQIMIAYAGRAAEAIHFGSDKITQGAGNDITQATNLLVNYVAKLGFDSATGLVDMSVLSNGITTDNTLSERVSALSIEFYQKALSRLRSNFQLVEMLSKKLLEVKTLSGDEAEALLREKMENNYDVKGANPKENDVLNWV